MNIEIPQYVIEIISKLEAEGFEGFVVGGCVRDMLMENPPAGGPKDWDVATSAKPEEIQKLFPDSVYENDFGTVGVKFPIDDLGFSNKEKKEKKYEIIEVTTYRIESKYTDKRHPDEVRFAKSLEEDLSRRDFSINAIALRFPISNLQFPIKSQISNVPLKEGQYEIIDPFNGQIDLKKKIIRAVGEAHERFNEDALRMMRAVRFAVTLNNQDTRNKIQTNSKSQDPSTWKIEEETFEAIRKNASNLKYISAERIKDELIKIILSPAPAQGIELLHETGLLKYIIPEIEAGFGVTQSHHHYYGPYNTVYKHLVASLEKCPSLKLEVRLASLLHDIGKPAVKRGSGENATFYNHEYVGAKLAKQILSRLKFSRAAIDKVSLLVQNHMFYYNVDEVGESGVRRVVRKVGVENINDLIDVRIADRLGSGVPKAVPYKLRHFKFMVDKVSTDPISVKQLKINGNDLMKELGLEPGPKIGAILDLLLSQVIDDPSLNSREKLLEMAKDLQSKDLEMLRSMAKERIKKEQEEEEAQLKKKYWVE